MFDTHSVKFIFNGFNIAEFVQELVSNNESLLFVHHCAEFIKSNGHTAFLEVHFLRSSEPEHIFTPFCNHFSIDKVFDTNVF